MNRKIKKWMVIILTIVIIGIEMPIILTLASERGVAAYKAEKQEQLEKWAYGQQFLNGTEQREYYVSIGFYGTTYEDFQYFADARAKNQQKLTIMIVFCGLGIFVLIADTIVFLVFYPD